MKKITFYIRLQDKDTKTELIKYDEACKIIANRLDMFTIQKRKAVTNMMMAHYVSRIH